MRRRLTIGMAILAIAACRAPAPEPEPVSTRVESPELGLTLASVPEPFVVGENAGANLRLDTTHPTGGNVAFAVGEPEYGLNLQAEVTRRGDAFRAMKGGEYHGSRELGTPFGPAYYCRGAYDTASGEREEQTWIFGLHPSGESRLLILTYTYPAGEGQTRVNELLALLGEVEAFVSEPEPSAS